MRSVADSEIGGIPELLREGRAVASTLPWIAGLVVGESDDLWIQEYQVPNSRDGVRWYAFDREDRWQGMVRGPSRFHLTNVTEDRIIGVWRDEFFAEHIHAYSLRRVD